MSNHKHLADLLKVCSILPALAIMPAMAEVVEKTGTVDSPVDYVTNQHTDEMGRDGDPMGLLRVLNMTAGSFSHDLDTNTLVVEPDTNGKITAQNLFVGIQSNTDADMVPSMVVKGNENTANGIISQLRLEITLHRQRTARQKRPHRKRVLPRQALRRKTSQPPLKKKAAL